MTFRHVLIAAGLALFPASVPVSAAAGGRPVAIELFTSQGCSSCPPAEALLHEYADRADVLALGFHVTYWNRLGWRDTFSFEGATQRQEAYSGSLGSGSPFTPQLVIDGHRSVVGSRRDEVAGAVARAAAEQRSAAEIGLIRDDGRLTIRIGPGRGSARILLVGFDRRQVTPIGRGENGGRTIAQANVVRSIRTVGAWNGAAVTFSETPPAGQDAAVLLQTPDGGIVGAARLSGA